MAKKSKPAKPAGELVGGIVMKRIAALQHDLDAAKLRIDALEAARLDYSAPQPSATLWRRFWS